MSGRGRIELNIERCPVNGQFRQYIVAHELGHVRDQIGGYETGGRRRDGRDDDEVERAADAYAAQWGFEAKGWR